jgi:tetratricopeptide (TPR) repeat protein
MIHPTYEGYINRAALKMLFKDYSNAMSDLNKASEMDSLRIDMYVNKGFVFLENGYLNEAFLNFSKALTIDPLNYNSNLGLGRTKQKMNDLNGALNNLNLALSSRETGEAYICRADIKMAMGDINGSKDDLEKALVLQPSKLDIYINMGMLELSRGNVDIAFQYYDKAVSLNKNNPQAYFYRALAKMENNRYKEALADMDTSISLKPYAQSYYYRGLINAKLGNTKNTSADLKQSAHMGYKNAELELKKKCK